MDSLALVKAHEFVEEALKRVTAEANQEYLMGDNDKGRALSEVGRMLRSSGGRLAELMKSDD